MGTLIPSEVNKTLSQNEPKVQKTEQNTLSASAFQVKISEPTLIDQNKDILDQSNDEFINEVYLDAGKLKEKLEDENATLDQKQEAFHELSRLEVLVAEKQSAIDFEIQ